MKNVFILATLFVSSIASLSTIAWADDGHGHKSNKGGDKMNSSMMGQEQMIAMHEHMQTMNNIMAQIKGTNDSKQRNQLMHNHMDEMQKGMRTMMHGNGNGNGNKVNNPQMDTRLDMMQNQMGMMQQMMEQIMQHQAEQSMPQEK
jgi:protein CpxP